MSRTLVYFPILPPNWINVSLRHPQGRIPESINAIHYEIWTFKSSYLVFCNCYCKSPPLQLCFAHRSISPPILVSFLFCFVFFCFLINVLSKLCFSYSNYALFVFVFLLLVILFLSLLLWCLVLIVTSLVASNNQICKTSGIILCGQCESREASLLAGRSCGALCWRRQLTISFFLRKANASLHAKLILSPLLVNSTGKNLLAKQIII